MEKPKGKPLSRYCGVSLKVKLSFINFNFVLVVDKTGAGCSGGLICYLQTLLLADLIAVGWEMYSGLRDVEFRI